MKPLLEKEILSRRKYSRLIPVLVLMTIILSAGCLTNLFARDRVETPHIIPVQDAPAPPQPRYSFPFQKITAVLTMPVNGSVFSGAKAADKQVVIYGNVSDKDWISANYQSLMDDPAEEEFYRDLITGLRKIRADNSLNDDEYLELIAVFVQSIRYETTKENPAKFPIETFTDKAGDCDDKSLLLAAILSRENYQTALLVFPPESHVAVGVVCPGTNYRNTGYTYIETTNVTYIGIPPDGLSGGIVLTSDPMVVTVGNGSKMYTACNQAMYIHGVYTASESRYSDLQHQVGTKHAELQALAASRNINAYNQGVAIYNSLVGRLKNNAELLNYILTHPYDRKGTYEWVRTHLSGL